MGKVMGRGQLEHHFWGTYCATIILGFADVASAADALPKMGAGWRHGTLKATGAPSRALVWHGSSDELRACKLVLAKHALKIAPCGFEHCKRQCSNAEIDGVPHSVDCGPAFSIVVEVTPGEQLQLPGTDAAPAGSAR